MPHYATDANQWLHENASKLARIRDSAERSRQAIEAARGHSRSRDGSVEVVVDVSGEIESLDISRTAMSLGPNGLAETLMMTIRSARENCAQQLRKELSEHPTPLDGMDVLEVLGVPAAEAAETRTDIPSTSPDDEPWGQRSILQRP